jgi:hypothetical protein
MNELFVGLFFHRFIVFTDGLVARHGQSMVPCKKGFDWLTMSLPDAQSRDASLVVSLDVTCVQRRLTLEHDHFVCI